MSEPAPSRHRAALTPTLRGGLYTFTWVVQRAVGIITLPVILARLEPEDFTRLGLWWSAFPLLLPLLTLSVHRASSRLWYDRSPDFSPEDLLRSTWTLAALAALGTGAVGLLLATAVGWEDPLTGGSGWWMGLWLLSLVALTVEESGATAAQARGRADHGAWMSLGRVLVPMLAVGLLALSSIEGAAAFRLVLGGQLLGLLLSSGIALATHASLLRQGRVRAVALRQAVAFTAPISLHLWALSALTMVGQWIGTTHLSLAEMAPYVLLCQIVALVQQAPRIVFQALQPEIGEAFAAGDLAAASGRVRMAARWAVLIVLLAYVGGAVILYQTLIPLPVSYRPPVGLLAIGLLSNLADAVYLRGVQVLVMAKRTARQARVSVAAAALTTLVSLALVGAWGLAGLMASMAAGFLLLATLASLEAGRVWRGLSAVSSP